MDGLKTYGLLDVEIVALSTRPSMEMRGDLEDEMIVLGMNDMRAALLTALAHYIQYYHRISVSV